MILVRDWRRLSAGLVLISGMFIAAPCSGDELILSSGESVEGWITGSTWDRVFINVDGEVRSVAHSDVTKYRFTYADVVLLPAGEKVEVKIIRTEEDNFVLLTADGVARWPTVLIKKFWYNTGSELESPELPVTDDTFKNQTDAGAVRAARGAEEVHVAPGEPHTRLAIGLRGGSDLAQLNDWQEQFARFSDGDEPSPLVFHLGGEIILFPLQSVYGGIGVEHLLGTNVDIIQEERVADQPTANQPTAWFVFGTVGFGTTSTSRPFLSVGGALDVGYLSAKEGVSGSAVWGDMTGSTLGFRPKFRASYAFEGNAILTAEIGYLIAKANVNPGHDLDFSGPTLVLGFAVVTPL